MITNTKSFRTGIELARGEGTAFGTFGELLQGVLYEEDKDFLVTFPISLFSRVTFTSQPEAKCLHVFPSSRTKAAKLASIILEHYKLPKGGYLEIQSNLPLGKGLASSSADLVAVIRSISNCFNIVISSKVVESFLAQIEPTDGVMYPGIVSFYHREVRVKEFIGQLPSLSVLSIDEGGIVDTIEFNKERKPFSRTDKATYSKLLNELTIAIRRKDLKTIGSITTQSALLNQRYRPKRTLYQLISLSDKVGGIGVVITHSGTCLGVLLDKEDSQYYKKMNTAYNELLKISDDVMIYHSLNNDS